MAKPAPWWASWNNLSYANPDVYGPVVGGYSVQEGVYQTLEKWLPAYIYEFNRVLGGDILTPPKEYRVKPQFRTLPPNTNEASILVVCGGTQARPVNEGQRTRAVWGVTVGVFVNGGSDWQETQALGFAYGAAVRTAIAQHGSLGGVAETSLWTGEKYLENEHLSTRTIGLCNVTFDVTTSQTLNINAGPPLPQFAAVPVDAEPSIAPPGAIPTVETAATTVKNTAV